MAGFRPWERGVSQGAVWTHGQADDEALLAAAAQAWEGMASETDALAIYRAETRELEGFGARLPDE